MKYMSRKSNTTAREIIFTSVIYTFQEYANVITK